MRWTLQLVGFVIAMKLNIQEIHNSSIFVSFDFRTQHLIAPRVKAPALSFFPYVAFYFDKLLEKIF